MVYRFLRRCKCAPVTRNYVVGGAGESVAFYGGQAKEREQSDRQFQGAYDVRNICFSSDAASDCCGHFTHAHTHARTGFPGAFARQLSAEPLAFWVPVLRGCACEVAGEGHHRANAVTCRR